MTVGDGLEDNVATSPTPEQLPAFMLEDEDEFDEDDTIYPIVAGNGPNDVCCLILSFDNTTY